MSVRTAKHAKRVDVLSEYNYEREGAELDWHKTLCEEPNCDYGWGLFVFGDKYEMGSHNDMGIDNGFGKHRSPNYF